MTMRLGSLLVLLALLLSVPPVLAQESPIALGSDPRIAAAGIRVGVFAEGLDYPMGLTELPDGSLLVALNRPVGGSFFNSTGVLMRLVDHDGDGRADGEGSVLAAGIPGPLVAVVQIDDLVFATSAKGGAERILAFRRGAHWRDPLDPAGAIQLRLGGSEHQSYGLAARHTPGKPGSIDLAFNLGAHGNLESGYEVGLAGLATGTFEDASIVMVTLTDDGTELTGGEAVQLARGLRNATTLVFDRANGDLVIGENGIDTPEDRIVSLSADELDRIPAAEIGGAVEDFGFPDTYIDYATGETVGTGGIAPQVAFTPIDGSENEGVAGIAPIPAGFPAELRGDWVAGFHGQFDGPGGDNEENPVVIADPTTGQTLQLVANDTPGVGHIDSFFAGKDVLWMADLCATGTLGDQPPCGVIYRVTAGD